MPIEFPCPKCSAVLRTPDEAAGKKARCPQCGAIADVPSSSVESTADQPSDAAPEDSIPREPTTGLPNAPAGSESGLPSLDQRSPFASPSPADSGSPYGDSVAAGEGKDVGGDAANPYASPDAFSATAGTVFGTPERGMQHSRIDFGDVFSTTWAIFSENLGPCVLVGLIKLGFDFALGIFGQIGNLAAQASGEPVAMIGFQAFHMILNILVQTWTNLGILYFGIKLTRTRQANVSDFFAVGPYYLRSLLVGMIVFLLFVFVTFVCMLPFGGLMLNFAVNGGPPAMEENLPILIISGVIGAILLMILFTWIGLRLFLTNVFIVDQDSGVFESLRQSDTYMRGNKIATFLVMVVVMMASVPIVGCTCGIGSIFYYPYLGVLTAVVYLMATGQAFPYRPSSQG